MVRKMNKALIIKVDGTEEPLEDLSLEALQKAVGGYIEAIYFNRPTSEGWDMAYIAEEGKIKMKREDGSIRALEHNEFASVLLSAYAGHYIAIDDTRGNIVLTKREYQS